MRRIDNDVYLPVLQELIEDGKEVSLLISGSSMSPFLIHQRDKVWIKRPDRTLRRGDMVFYRRPSGAYVMHRIHHIDQGGIYWIVGDAQTMLEAVEPSWIFGLIVKVSRKGRILAPGDFWWEFFEHVWIRMIPVRRWMVKIYGIRKK